MSEDTTLDQSMVNEQQPDQAQENPSSENVGQLIYEAKKHRQDKAKLREQLEAFQNQAKESDELKLKENEEYKALSERISQERDEYKLKADEFEKFQQEFRSNLLENLSDEQKEIAVDLPLNKLQKFVDMNKVRPIATQESSSTKMALEKDAWKDMNQSDRRQNWGTIVDTYRNKS